LAGDDKKDQKDITHDVTLDSPYEQERKQLSKQDKNSPADGQIEGIEFWGNLPGHLLIEMGIKSMPDKSPVKANQWVAVNAISIHSQLVYLRILDIGESRPYSKAVCYSVVDSFWGVGAPRKMAHTQSMVNSAARSILINMMQSSGPQVILDDVNRLDPRCNMSMKPWKVWLYKPGMSGYGSNRPMYFFQPSDNTPQLLAVFDRFMKQSDDDTGVPSVAYGNSFLAGGAARTMGGLQIIMEGVEKGLREITRRIDSGFLKPSMYRMYEWNMLYSEDEGIKCDAHPTAKGILAIALKQQQASRYFEILIIVKGDPILAQIVGGEGIKNLFSRAIESSLDIDPREILPSRSQRDWERIEANIAMQMAATQAERDGATAQQGMTSTQAANSGAQAQQAIRGAPPQQPPQDPAMIAGMNPPMEGGGGAFAA